MQRNGILAIFALVGLALFLVLLFSAIRDPSVASYTKAITAAIVTIGLIFSSRKTQKKAVETKDKKMFSIGLAIGLFVPLILIYFLTLK